MRKTNKSVFPDAIYGFSQKFVDITQLHSKPTPKLRAWLLSEASLTQKLYRKFGDFSVEVVFEGWVFDHEVKQFFRRALKDKTYKVSRFWCRKVNLICNGQIVVRAHTLVPLQTFHNQTRRIGKLKSRSLGQFLFTQKHITRWPIRIHSNTQNYWGRQSIFSIQNYPLLVTEYFEPNFLDS